MHVLYRCCVVTRASTTHSTFHNTKPSHRTHLQASRKAYTHLHSPYLLTSIAKCDIHSLGIDTTQRANFSYHHYHYARSLTHSTIIQNVHDPQAVLRHRLDPSTNRATTPRPIPLSNLHMQIRAPLPNRTRLHSLRTHVSHLTSPPSTNPSLPRKNPTNPFPSSPLVSANSAFTDGAPNTTNPSLEPPPSKSADPPVPCAAPPCTKAFTIPAASLPRPGLPPI